MQAQYANMVRVSATKSELVFEFGDFFPNQEEGGRVLPNPAMDLKTRVVVSADMIEVLIKSLNEALALRDKVRQAVEQEPKFLGMKSA